MSSRARLFEIVLAHGFEGVRRPRVRGVNGGEIELPTWRHFAEEDPLDERALEQILAGVSTRKYGRSLTALLAGLEAGARGPGRG